MSLNRLALLSLSLLLTVVAGCPGERTPAAGSGAGTAEKKSADREVVVATIGDTKLTAGMISDELNKQNPYMRMRFSSPERMKEFVKNLVRFEVLAKEATQQGMEQDPEVIRRVKRTMIDRLMEKMHGSLVKIEDITDKDIEAFYNSNRQLYHQPAKARASWIVVATEAEAKKLLAQAKKKPTDVKFFGELAQQNSTDDATKGRGGDLDFFTRDEARVPKPVSEAVFAAKGNWQYVGPIKIEKGWAIAMKTGEVDESSRPLAVERDRIKNRLYNERRVKALEKYVDDLEKKAKVEINDANLAKVKIDMTPGPLMPGMPGMGMPGRPHRGH